MCVCVQTRRGDVLACEGTCGVSFVCILFVMVFFVFAVEIPLFSVVRNVCLYFTCSAFFKNVMFRIIFHKGL